MVNVVVNDSTIVGKHCIINTHATVERDDCVSDYVHISIGAVLCGTVCVGECTHVGVGAVLKI